VLTRKNANQETGSIILKTRIFSLAGRVIVGLVLILSVPVKGQIYRIGGGLSFASGTEFNSGETGNPGLKIKTWITLDKRQTIHIVPSISVYNPYKLEKAYLTLTNYMFHGDLDGQYTFFQEGTLKVAGFAGANFTYLVSDYEQLVDLGKEVLSDATDFSVGANVGGCLEMRMGPRWDFNVSGKYLFSKYDHFIISVEGVYYFRSRRRTYRR